MSFGIQSSKSIHFFFFNDCATSTPSSYFNTVHDIIYIADVFVHSFGTTDSNGVISQCLCFDWLVLIPVLIVASI
jgi:hypothetical protein